MSDPNVGRGRLEIEADTSKVGQQIADLDKGLSAGFAGATGSAEKMGGKIDEVGTKSGDLAVTSGSNFGKMNAVLVGAGLAVGAFAVNAVGDYQKLGLEVGKFRDATGLSADESSRWIEVAGDHGIAASTLEGIFGRMNVTAGKSPEAFAEFGIEIARTKDGAVDANQTFLNTIDRLNQIEDPAKRAEAGTKLFGRGWREVAELVGMGSAQITRDLDAVAGNKVFTDKDVTEARGLRDAFDSIADAGEELSLGLAKTLAPVISDLAPLIVTLVENLQPFVDILAQGLKNALEEVGPLLEVVADIIGFVGDLFPDVDEDLGTMVDLLDANQDKLEASGESFMDLFEKIQTGGISLEQLSEKITAAGGTLNVLETNGVLASGSIRLVGDEALAAAGSVGDMIGGLASATLETSKWEAANIAANTARAQASYYEKLWTADVEAAAAAEAEREEAVQVGVDALAEYREEQERAEDAIRAQIDAILEQNDALRSTADAHFALADSTDEFNRFLSELDEKVKEAGTDQAALNAIYRDGTRAASDVADAAIRVYEEQAKANGTTVSATQKIDTWNQAMLTSAATASGPQRQAILDYIAASNGIPASKVTEIQAAVDAGDIATATAIINETSKSRTVAIKADADNASFTAIETELGTLTRPRFVTINGSLQVPKFASGTDFAPGGLAYVHRDELIELPRGSKVHTAEATRTMFSERTSLTAATSPGSGGFPSSLVLEIEGEPFTARIKSYDRERSDRRKAGARP